MPAKKGVVRPSGTKGLSQSSTTMSETPSFTRPSNEQQADLQRFKALRARLKDLGAERARLAQEMQQLNVKLGRTKGP
jgi:hypothetical protein